MDCAGAARLVPELCGDPRLEVRRILAGTRVLGTSGAKLALRLLRTSGPRYLAWQLRRRLSARRRGQPVSLTDALGSDASLLRRVPTLRDPRVVEELRSLDAELFVCCIFPERLRPEALALPSLGTINLHGSLLPRWRGIAPLEHALAAGDEHHGATVHVVDEGLDTGPILAQRSFELGDVTSFQDGWERSMQASSAALDEALARLQAEGADALRRARTQPADGASYASFPSRATLARLRARGVRLD